MPNRDTYFATTGTANPPPGGGSPGSLGRRSPHQHDHDDDHDYDHFRHFIDTIAAITILVPVFLPIIEKLAIDPVQFGVIMVLNLMIGLLTPPVGMSLYMVSNIGRIPLERVMAGAVPFIVSLIIALAIVTFVPAFSTWLPGLVMR